MTESPYPRKYKFGPWALLMYSVCCLLFVAAGVGIAFWLELGAKVRTWNLALELLVCLPISLFGLFTWVSVFKSKLVLYQDYLVYHGALRVRTIYRSNIRTTRGVRVSYGNLSVVLVLKDPPKKALRIAAFGSGDDAFADWFEDLPNEEGEEEAKAGEALLANPAFGSNPTEREQTINRDAQWLNRLRWPAYGIARPMPIVAVTSGLVSGDCNPRRNGVPVSVLHGECGRLGRSSSRSQRNAALRRNQRQAVASCRLALRGKLSRRQADIGGGV